MFPIRRASEFFWPKEVALTDLKTWHEVDAFFAFEGLDEVERLLRLGLGVRHRRERPRRLPRQPDFLALECFKVGNVNINDNSGVQHEVMLFEKW